MRPPHVLLLLAAALPGLATAGGAHEHGVGELAVAVEDGAVELLLTAPLADLVGREHAPENEAERATVTARRDALLAAPVFRFEGAQCERLAADFPLPEAFTAPRDHQHDHDHDDEHEHEHEHEHEEDHAHGDGHHADGLLTWRFRCDRDPAALLVDFEALAPLLLLRTQTLTDSGAAALELSAEAPRAPLR